MTCSALTSGSFSLPRLSISNFGRSAFFNDGPAFRNSSCDGKRGSRQLTSPCISRKLQLRMATPLGYKKSSFLLGCYQKKKSFLWQFGADPRCKVQFEIIGRSCKRDLCRRGLKRIPKARSSNLRCCPEARGCFSRWKDQSALGAVPPVANRFLPRKKLRSWEEDSSEGTLSHNEDDGDLSSGQVAALATVEQAIQSQVVEETRLFFGGPSRGDLAEVEAFCRIYRHAEQFHFTVMNALRSINENPGDKGTDGLYNGDASLAEERVASALAHLMAVLQESKSEILKPNSSLNGGGFFAQQGPNDLPYFARLRKDVRARLRTVVAALDALMVRADSAQRLAIETQVLKLQNAALDAGFPRPEGMPSAGDIPNLASVRLRPSKGGRALFKDEEDVTFWRGGQMTEAGMDWLVQKGFKTIVDMREASAESIVEGARSEAVASGRVRVVRMAVESGSVPTKEQVEEFAHLVEDAENRPLYLLTRAGVSRASAIVSRWREFVLRGQVQSGAVKKEIEQGTLSGDLELLTGDDAVKISQEDALALETALVRTVDETVASYALEEDDRVESDAIGGLDEASVSGDEGQVEEEASPSEDEMLTPDGVEVASSEKKELVQASANGSLPHGDRSIDFTKNAFEAQRPVRNILSRKAMSKFMKRRKVPAIFLTSRINRANRNLASTSSIADSVVNLSLGGPDNRYGLSSPSYPSRGRPSSEASSRLESEQTAAQVNSPTTNGSYTTKANGKANGNGSSGVSRGPSINGSVSNSVSGVERNQQEEVEGTDRPSGDPLYVTAPEGGRDGGESVKLEEDDEDLGSVQGDMCASTTGVVRVQSRKKAEMFLVRTDGYSCTRERVKESTLGFSHPSTQQQMLMWKTAPRTVLILKKLGSELTKETQEVASFLHFQEGMNVMVEPDVHDGFARMPGFGFIQTFHSQDTSELHERVDFVVCLGGDGVILHVSNLFRNAVPPVVSFNLGSLGFLTSHSYSSHKEDLHSVIHGYNDMMTGVYITLRMRLRCELYRNGKAIPGKVFDVLNEVVVDRGSNPYLSKIECYERDRLITKVQADGVIVATPTGSTAYSIAAGGSMVHPNVPCMLFTPICPHSLSFRPVILPDSAVLELKVPGDARNNAWVSFDGKRRQQLSRGDSVRITMSEHPLPTVNKNDQTDDWFRSLVRCLSWNERLEQRPLSPK